MIKFLLLTGLLLAGLSLPAQQEGDQFFGAWTVHDIRLQFSQPGYWDSLTQNYKTDTYMRCDVSVDGQAYPQCGVKFKGNSSYNNPSRKKPFRIDFEEYAADQTLDGLKKLVLNNGFKDPSLLREKLMLDFLQAQQIAGPRATFARLYLNGHYWGLYTVVEDVNKTFLKDRYGNKDGNLFKGDPKGTLTWKGADPSPYQSDYELKTNETANDWSDLLRLLDVLNNTPTAQLRDSLSRYLNLNSWVDYWAAHNLFVNLDSYIGSGHNYFLYHNTETGRFEWITWDVNEAFGNFQMGISLPNLKMLPFTHIPQPMAQRPLMNRLLPDPVFKQQLADRFCALLPSFTNARLDAHIDSLATLIRPHVYADTLKFFSNAQFEQNLSQDLVPGPGAPAVTLIAGLKPFIKTRHDALQQQLAAYGCVATAIADPPARSLLRLSPNPASTYLFLETPGLAPESLRLLDAAGRSIRTWQPLQQEQQTLELEGIPAGFYTLSVAGAAQRYALKVLVLR
ncbi:MAG: CotH kinase family protein [Saprospiraceae bacterium]|nr:CotH kinase family protein [Saprospiraceae bacterium]